MKVSQQTNTNTKTKKTKSKTATCFSLTQLLPKYECNEVSLFAEMGNLKKKRTKSIL